MGQVSERIGYHKSFRDRLSRDLHGKVADFQAGVSFWSCIAWTLHHEHYYILEEERPFPVEVLKRLYDLVSFPYAYLKTLGKDRYEAPPEYWKKGAIEWEIAESMRRLSDLEAEYGFEINHSELSPAGREAYCLNE